MADLAYLLLLLVTISAIIILLLEFRRRGGYLTLPFLTSLLFLAWYLPQAWALLDYPGISPKSLVRLLLMSLLCFWAIMLGWYRGLGRGWSRPQPLKLPVKRLLVPVYAITFFAMAMNQLIEMQPPEVRVSTQWTGVITILAFFASVRVVSMAISTAMVLQHRSLLTLVLFALNVAMYLPLIFIYFRRAETLEFTLAILLGLYFVRGRALPRVAIVMLAVASFFIVNAVGQLRDLNRAHEVSSSGTIEARVPTWSEVSEIDWLAAVNPTETIPGSEVMNAVVALEALANQGTFSLGAEYWNKLVFAYVPGQLIGKDLKHDLMIGNDAMEIAQSQFYYQKRIGTTVTGFVEPYHDFWFFGCLVWWLTGYVMGRVMKHALEGGLIAYALYAATIANAGQVTTHSGYYLFTQSLLPALAILLIAIWLKRLAIHRPLIDRREAIG